jgi:hypothetical protein
MALSVGYKTKKDRWQHNVRYVQEAELWEGSLVSFGMNTQAVVTSVKQEDVAMDEILASLPALAAEMRGFLQVYRAPRDPDAAAWAHLHADMQTWLAQHTAEPSLEDQMSALAADIRRWIRHYR